MLRAGGGGNGDGERESDVCDLHGQHACSVAAPLVNPAHEGVHDAWKGRCVTLRCIEAAYLSIAESTERSGFVKTRSYTTGRLS